MDVKGNHIIDQELDLELDCQPPCCYTALRKDLDLRGAKTVVDLGAHAGSLSLIAARSGAELILAFEPVWFGDLIRNIRSNDLDNTILPFPVPIIRELEPTRVRFGRPGNNGTVSMYSRPDGDLPQIMTWGIPLWEILKLVPHIDYLKVDIEGAEYELFGEDEFTFKLGSRVGFLDLEIHEPVGSQNYMRKNLARLAPCWREHTSMHTGLRDLMSDIMGPDNIRFRGV